MSDRVKAILQLLGILVLGLLVLRGFLSLATKPRTVVRYPDAVRGRITGTEVNRQSHLYFLNGDTKHRYSFNAFRPPFTPAEQQLSLEEKNALGLGQRLQIGDYLTKAANSTTLLVQRGDSTSQWFCAPAGPAD